MPPLRQASVKLLVLAAAAAAAGCAAEQMSRSALLERHAAAFVHHHSRDEVIAGARALLEDRGYDVMPVQRGEALATEWRLLFGTDEFATSHDRYFVVVHRLTPEHTRIEAIRLVYSTLGMETHHPQIPFVRDGMSENVNSAAYEKGWKPRMMGKPQWGRALDIEWALIQRLEPARSRQIEAAVDYLLRNERERGGSASSAPEDRARWAAAPPPGAPPLKSSRWSDPRARSVIPSGRRSAHTRSPR
jgi:hypothetical protein